MIVLDDIRHALNPKYIQDDNIMSEKKESMVIPISYNDSFILFNSDSKIRCNDCFNPNMEVINRKADYIIFAIRKDTIYAVIVELKVSDNPKLQLDLTVFLVNYILGRILYKHQEKNNIVIRKLGIFKDLPRYYKGLTKPGKLYVNGYEFCDTKELHLGQYL